MTPTPDTARPLPRRWGLWLIVLLAASMVGCGSRAPSYTPTLQPTPAPLSLTIVHTNDTWGYLDPCG